MAVCYFKSIIFKALVIKQNLLSSKKEIYEKPKDTIILYSKRWKAFTTKKEKVYILERKEMKLYSQITLLSM
jgi:hypothetical protein